MMITGKQPPRFTVTITDLETGEAHTHTNMEGVIVVAGKSKAIGGGFESSTMVHGAPKIILPLVLGWDELGKDIRESVAKSIAEDLFKKDQKVDRSDIPEALKKMLGLG